jgi:hypothetical protein
MALVSKTFSQIITFTRASTATYFDSTGTLTSAAVDAPRLDYNPNTLAAQGLLIEESRTNIQLQSEDLSSATGWGTTGSSISTNATTAPTGAVTADKLVEDTSTGLHLVASTNAVTVGVAYTFTVFAKAAERTQFQISGMGLTGAGFNILVTLTGAGSVSGAPVGTAITLLNNGWYRVSVPFTPTNTTPPVYSLYDGTTNSYTGNGTSGLFLWGSQTEAGAFPTSYIPTTTTALTRAADVASVNTLSPWYNATAGTIFVEAANAQVSASLFSTDDGTASNRIITYFNVANSPAFRVVSGGVDQANFSAGTIAQNATFKLSTAYATNDFAASLNGAAAVTDTSGTVPSGQTTARIGSNVSSANFINGYLRRITYYPRRLSNAELQAITA